MSEYPEHEKMQAVVAETQAAGEFAEWLSSKGMFIAYYPEGHNFPRETPAGITTLLAEWTGIDLRKIETEKRQMLASLREAG